MSEDNITAARMMQRAADDMMQASRNMQGTVDQLSRMLDQFSNDMAVLVYRLEEVKRS